MSTVQRRLLLLLLVAALSLMGIGAASAVAAVEVRDPETGELCEPYCERTLQGWTQYGSKATVYDQCLTDVKVRVGSTGEIDFAEGDFSVCFTSGFNPHTWAAGLFLTASEETGYEADTEFQLLLGGAPFFSWVGQCSLMAMSEIEADDLHDELSVHFEDAPADCSLGTAYVTADWGTGSQGLDISAVE